MNLAETITESAWPISRLGEAMQLLAERGGLSPNTTDIRDAPPITQTDNTDILDRWLDSAARQMGIEAELTDTAYNDLEQLIRTGGPALLRLAGEGAPQFLALLKGRSEEAAVIRPDNQLYWFSLDTICTTLCKEHQSKAASVERVLERAGVPAKRRARSRKAILQEQLGGVRISNCWLLRLAPGGSLWDHVRHSRLRRWMLGLVGGHTIQYTLWLLSWWMIGQTALQGRFDSGWLMAWALVVISMVPFRLLVTWSQGMLAIGGGAILKQRLLAGALKLEPEEIRHQGSGQLLGRVLESEAVESLALSGGFLGVVATIELVLAGGVLGAGLGGWLQPLLLTGWTGIGVFIAKRYFKDRQRWTESRLAMTHELVERMVGHRTRLAQESPERWHQGEDQTLDRYIAVSKQMDRKETLLTALIPRGWLLLGMIGITYPFVYGSVAPARLALGLGGVLLAYRALQKLTIGLAHIASAAISWRQIAPLYQAAARPENIGSAAFAAVTEEGGARQKLIQAQDLVFRYRTHGEAVLKNCSLSVQEGDRVLLQGESGGGKSTFASILTSVRSPESGLLLLRGLDRPTLGDANWRQRVVSAPQFHENHVLTGTFAFNLLMGRRWPPRHEDVEEAEAICRELGLEEVIQRMPAGLLQMVGETGWQLSQGEKSRLYIARALLQKADLVILDESFASLDPINLKKAIQCVLERAQTLVVIAHP